jgi:hypothetical protein
MSVDSRRRRVLPKLVPKIVFTRVDKRVNWVPRPGQRAVIDSLCEKSGQHSSLVFRALIKYGLRTVVQIEKLGGVKAVRVLLTGKPESSLGGLTVRFSAEMEAEIMSWLSRVDYGAKLSVGIRWLIYYALQLLSTQPESFGVDMVKQHARLEQNIGIRIGKPENEFQVALRLAAEAATEK